MNKEEKTNKFSFHEQRKDNLSENRGSVGMDEALKLLDEEEGHKISAKASSLPRDSLFAYILLRHMRIRDTKYKVREEGERIRGKEGGRGKGGEGEGEGDREGERERGGEYMCSFFSKFACGLRIICITCSLHTSTSFFYYDLFILYLQTIIVKVISTKMPHHMLQYVPT